MNNVNGTTATINSVPTRVQLLTQETRQIISRVAAIAMVIFGFIHLSKAPLICTPILLLAAWLLRKDIYCIFRSIFLDSDSPFRINRLN